MYVYVCTRVCHVYTMYVLYAIVKNITMNDECCCCVLIVDTKQFQCISSWTIV